MKCAVLLVSIRFLSSSFQQHQPRLSFNQGSQQRSETRFPQEGSFVKTAVDKRSETTYGKANRVINLFHTMQAAACPGRGGRGYALASLLVLKGVKSVGVLLFHNKKYTLIDTLNGLHSFVAFTVHTRSPMLSENRGQRTRNPALRPWLSLRPLSPLAASERRLRCADCLLGSAPRSA